MKMSRKKIDAKIEKLFGMYCGPINVLKIGALFKYASPLVESGLNDAAVGELMMSWVEENGK